MPARHILLIRFEIYPARLVRAGLSKEVPWILPS